MSMKTVSKHLQQTPPKTPPIPNQNIPTFCSTQTERSHHCPNLDKGSLVEQQGLFHTSTPHPQNLCMADLPQTIRSRLWLECFHTCTPTHCTQGSPAFSEPTHRARAGISLNLFTNILNQQNQHLSALECQL